MSPSSQTPEFVEGFVQTCVDAGLDADTTFQLLKSAQHHDMLVNSPEYRESYDETMEKSAAFLRKFWKPIAALGAAGAAGAGALGFKNLQEKTHEAELAKNLRLHKPTYFSSTAPNNIGAPSGNDPFDYVNNFNRVNGGAGTGSSAPAAAAAGGGIFNRAKMLKSRLDQLAAEKATLEGFSTSPNASADPSKILQYVNARTALPQIRAQHSALLGEFNALGDQMRGDENEMHSSANRALNSVTELRAKAQQRLQTLLGRNAVQDQGGLKAWLHKLLFKPQDTEQGLRNTAYELQQLNDVEGEANKLRSTHLFQ